MAWKQGCTQPCIRCGQNRGQTPQAIGRVYFTENEKMCETRQKITTWASGYHQKQPRALGGSTSFRARGLDSNDRSRPRRARTCSAGTCSRQALTYGARGTSIPIFAHGDLAASERRPNSIRTRSEQGPNKVRTRSEQGPNKVRTRFRTC
jgi:hypothetical protein